MVTPVTVVGRLSRIHPKRHWQRRSLGGGGLHSVQTLKNKRRGSRAMQPSAVVLMRAECSQSRHNSAMVRPGFFFPPKYVVLPPRGCCTHQKRCPAAPLHHKYKRELPLPARVTTQWVPLSPTSWLRPGQPRSSRIPQHLTAEGGALASGPVAPSSVGTQTPRFCVSLGVKWGPFTPVKQEVMQLQRAKIWGLGLRRQFPGTLLVT